MANTKAEELTLLDRESNKEYKIIVSHEDAEKTRNDHEFAYLLLQQAKRYATENMGTSRSRVVQTERGNTNDTDPVASCSASCSASDLATDVNDYHIWTRAETLILINVYKEHMAMFDNPKISSKQCWNFVSEKMKNAGFQISGIKCATKLQSLKRTYKCVVDHNKKSGNNKKDWEYYEIMHEIFETKPWIKPITTAGSNINITNSDKENIDSKTSVSKKRKVHNIIEDYFEKSLEIKKEKESNTQKRHQEKMSRLEKIDNLMTEILKK